MCGIAGVLFHGDGPHCPRRSALPPRFTRTLIDTLKHRGPDGHGVFVDDGVALVHTRLAMLDREGGAQPMRTPDGRFTLVVNGEIYNHRRLRPILEARGAIFRTKSDSEVLLWALAQAVLAADHPAAPLDLVARGTPIEGEYAFCLWDGRARRAILGRDPLGVKPLVVARSARGALWFASEVKALHAVGLGTEPDPRALADAFASPALSGERPPFHGLRSWQHASVVDERIGERAAPVRLTIGVRAAGGAIPEGARDIAHNLAAAVADRLDADVPVGAFLSGGVDSSAIVAAALHAGASERDRFRCFSIRFDDGAGAGANAGSIVVGDDEPYTELLAERWPIALTRVHASRASLIDDVENLFASQDRVAAWEQELTQRALAEAAALEVRAVLVGDAADETHFGYAFAFEAPTCHSPTGLLDRFAFPRRLALLRSDLAHHASSLPQRLAQMSSDRFVHDDGSRGAARANRRAMEALIRRHWLPRLLHNGDLHTMAFGVEARVPFADTRVLGAASLVDVDAAFADVGGDDALPGPEKRALRAAVAPWLPAEIVARRKSALPRDEGTGPAWRDLARAILADARGRERLGAVLDVQALRSFVDDCAGDAVGDTERAILFSVIGIDGFLRHHASSS